MVTPSPKRSRDRWWWLLGRLLVVILLMLTPVLLVLSRAAPQYTAQLRGYALDIASPVLDAAITPVRIGAFGVAWVKSYLAARDHALKADRTIAQLRILLERNAALVEENNRLRGLLRVSEPSTKAIGVARIVGSSAGSILSSAILTKGANQNVRVGQPVRNAEGLVGRVLETGRISSRVLLITDPISRIPVKIARTGQAAMAVGANTPNLHLMYLDSTAGLHTGDRIVTSGQGGLFPPNIPVGRLVLSQTGDSLVVPFARFSSLDYVLILETYIEPEESNIMASPPSIVRTPTIDSIP